MLKRMCIRCGNTFDANPGEIIRDSYQEAELSPCCGAASVSLAECPRCGALVFETNLVNGICQPCADALLQKLRRHLRRNYTPQELDALDWLTEGQSLVEIGGWLNGGT